MAKSPKTGETAQFWLLAVVVIAVTAGVIVWLGSGEQKADQTAGPREQAVDDNVVEVQPLIPRGKIASASWRDGGAVDAKDKEESTSLLDDTELDMFGEKAEAKQRRDEDLKEIVDRIHGLGVYVAPSDKKDDK